MSQERAAVEVVGFKNSIYAGQTRKNKNGVKLPEGFGMLVDNLFFTVLGQWTQDNRKTVIQGPSLIIYPKGELFYSSNYSKEGSPAEIWCFVSQRYKIRIFGHLNNPKFAVLSSITGERASTVSCMSLNEKGSYIEKDIACQNQSEVWQAVRQIVGIQIPPNYQTVEKFISSELIDKNSANKNSVLSFPEKKGRHFYGICNSRGEGLGFLLNQGQCEVEEIGSYHKMDQGRQLIYGKRLVRQPNQTDIIEEGHFVDQGEAFFTYKADQRRPAEASKAAQKYFRQTDQFSNEFIQLVEADEIYKETSSLTEEFFELSQTRNAQKILEDGPNRETERRKVQQQLEKMAEKQKPAKDTTQTARMGGKNKQYTLDEAKQKIAQDILRKKKTSRTGNLSPTRRSYEDQSSPYKRVDSTSYKGDQRKAEYPRQYDRQVSPRRMSPRKFEYLDDGIETNRVNAHRQTASFRNPLESKNLNKYPRPQVRTTRDYKVDVPAKDWRRQQKQFQTERFRQLEERCFKYEKQALDREAALQIELETERRILDSYRLNNTLNAREIAAVGDLDAMIMHNRLSHQNSYGNTPHLLSNENHQNYTDKISYKDHTNSNLGKRYARQNFAYTEETPARQIKESGRSPSPSPFKMRTTASRRPFKYTD